MMRLDKLLCELNIGTRSQVKDLIKKGAIMVDNVIVKKADEKVNENTAIISFNGKDYSYRKFRYFMLNKPSGVITATDDAKDITVMDIFRKHFPDEKADDLSPVGRLDKDTVGLLLITNDGALSHQLLAPKKHVDKKYYVELDKVLTQEGITALTNGVHIGEGENTAPSTVEPLSDTSCYITIHEGKFHQVKRMFFAVGCEVTFLKRVAFGPLVLDDTLKEGDLRVLTPEEISLLQMAPNQN